MFNKLLSYSTPILLVVIIVILLFGVGKTTLGGTTNYDTIQLTPVSSADNALDVRNSSAVSRFVVDGNGLITASGQMALSSASSTLVTGKLNFQASSTQGIIFRINDGTCLLFNLSNGGNVATSTTTCTP